MRRNLLVVFVVLLTAGTTNLFALDKANGGGWFTVGFVPPPGPSDAEANFGFNAKYTRRGVQGHLNYHNRATGLTVNGPVTDFSPGSCPDTGEATAVLSGFCKDGSCSFEFEVIDNGEPGKGRDRICRYHVFENDEGPDSNFDRLLNSGNIQVR